MLRRGLHGIFAVVMVLSLMNFAGCGGAQEKGSMIKVPVKQGQFEAAVHATGELKAKESVDILGPSSLRSVGIWQVSITDIVPEGTVVSKGEYVATLDRTEASSKLKDLQAELEKYKSQHVQTKLDTSLSLREARDQLVNLKYGEEESKLTLDQSQFEPPAIIRQAEINFEKAKRAYSQAVKSYDIKQRQAIAKIQEIEATMSIHQNKISLLIDVLDEFIVKAPMDGMVVYMRDWRGRKRGVGSTISPWELEVATLPDMSRMMSVTYINEVDISRIKNDLEVEIGIDAFPDASYTGKVTKVANIGEQRPNSDSKVFEVQIVVDEADTTLRPSMTTSNLIVTNTRKDALFVPIESIHKIDSVQFVYRARGSKILRREVITGISNENEQVIEAGLKSDDMVLLSVPENPTRLKFESLAEDEKSIAEKKINSTP